MASGTARADQGADGALRRRRRNEFRAVEIRTAQRDEQGPGLQSPAIRGDRAVGMIRADQLSADRRRRVAAGFVSWPLPIMPLPLDSAAPRAGR